MPRHDVNKDSGAIATHHAAGAAAIRALAINATAIASLKGRIDGNFYRALDLIVATDNRVILSGIGKSGLVARKVSATMASLGTPSFFMHSADAAHGDLGMVRPGDIMILLSSSGETEEVLKLVPFLRRNGSPIIAITGNLGSTLARHADVALDASIEREACPHNLAPTTSTLVAMALGDALAIAAGSARDFRPADFAEYHPGGSIGQRLLTKVRDAMRRDGLPICTPDASLREMLQVMSAGRLGLVLVMTGGRLDGIVTDGDLRRGLERADEIDRVTAADVMTRNPQTIEPDGTLFDADARMHAARITALVVADPRGQVLGIVQIHD